MSLADDAVPVFAAHQTFHPRFGWFKKGFDAASRDPAVFSAPDATVRLGVGKNMVDAIRHWSIATGILAKVPDPQRPRTHLAAPTRLGDALLADDGFDPHFEDPTTLWILHWKLCTPPAQPIWRLTFATMTALEFDEDQLLGFCLDEVAAAPWGPVREPSIRKDVDCLLRMYTSRKARGRQTLDDLLDSPFRELGIISKHPVTPGRYRFIRGWKPSLTDTAVAFACLDYMHSQDPGASTASVSRLVNDPGAPGQVLKITEIDIVEALTRVAAEVRTLRLASPGGAVQLSVDGSVQQTAVAVLFSRLLSRRRAVPQETRMRTVIGSEALIPVDLEELADASV